MSAEGLPATLEHYLHSRLDRLDPRARLVCVLDPACRLNLSESVSFHGGTWSVLRYAGNDLAFRAAYVPGQPTLIWITQPDPRPEEVEAPLRLSSLADILAQADAILDLSLAGVLAELVPGEAWPSAPLRRHAALFAQHLAAVVSGHERLRRDLPQEAALDASSLRTLALRCYQEQIPAEEFLFHQDTLAGMLNHCITLAWKVAWGEEAAQLLREQAQEAMQHYGVAVCPWLEVPLDALARYVYLYRFLSRVRLTNISNHLRGLGLLGFDPEPLEAQVTGVLDLWERDLAWRQHVIQQAEAGLTASDVKRVVDLLDVSGDELLAVLWAAESPALAYELAVRAFLSTGAGERRRQMLTLWADQRPFSLGVFPETAYLAQAQMMVRVLDELSFIEKGLAAPLPEFSSLATAVDWYVQSGACLLELAHARAVTASRGLAGGDVQPALQQCLNDAQGRIRAYLDEADHALAELVRKDVGGYLNSPRLSINVLRDTILVKRVAPTSKASVWIVVLDGMRWDTWREVVKPRLLQTFEIKQEKAYLSLLPSWTYVARGGLLAGKIPSHWLGYRNTFTAQQPTLVAKALGLAEGEQDRKLRFHSRLESDRSAQQLDATKRVPYNVLIFNISDDNLHHLKGNLDVVNRVVEELLGEILDTLHMLVRPEDTVVLASDHGFIELHREDAVIIRDDARWQRYVEGGRHPVTYRYLAGVEPPAGLSDAPTFSYKGMPEGRFTVAVGRRWFQREDAHGEPDRYAHGGLSFGEMVVPGVVLQRITEKRWEVSLAELPREITVEEGQELACALVLANTGNQATHYELAYRSDTEAQSQTLRGELQPGERRALLLHAQVRYRESGASTKAFRLQLSYGPSPDALQPSLPREIPVTVIPQKGKVEISLGALDDLDR